MRLYDHFNPKENGNSFNLVVIRTEQVTLERVAQLEMLIFNKSISTPKKIDGICEVPHLLLVAVEDGNHDAPVGFKLGYGVARPYHFHSWLGGVIPEYQRHGIGAGLLRKQEEWARSKGFQTIGFNTFAKFPEMQAMGRKAGYRLVRTSNSLGEMKLWYEKQL